MWLRYELTEKDADHLRFAYYVKGDDGDVGFVNFSSDGTEAAGIEYAPSDKSGRFACHLIADVTRNALGGDIVPGSVVAWG